MEYEWRPPRCYKCKFFGHVDSLCPKRVIQVEDNNKTTHKIDDGFQQVTKRCNHGLVIGNHNLDAR